MAENTKKDPLGEFLAKYDEYLDGQRSFNDLPAFPVAIASGSTTPSSKPIPVAEDPVVTIRRLRLRLYVIEPVYRAAIALHRAGGIESRDDHVLVLFENAVDRARAIEQRPADEDIAISDVELERRFP